MSLINTMAKEYLKQLRASGGCPTDEDIVEIYELSKQASYVFENCLLTFQYKVVGNLKIYPLTIGAKLWLEEAGRWWAEDDAMQTLSVVYACCHSREPEAFQFESPADAKWKIKRELKKANVTEEEFIEVLDTLQRQQEGKGSKEDLSFVPYLSLLMRHYGHDVDYWLWNISDETAAGLLRELARQEGGQKTADAVDPSIQAAVKIKLRCNQILERKENGR